MNAILILILLFISFAQCTAEQTKECYRTMKNVKPVLTHQLNNGLMVLVRPANNLPKVSVQIWYDVGSKDEASGEKGIAHLIEHMIFKGTESKDGKGLQLTESDINDSVHKLSGNCNAFTSFDYTGYLFNLPTQNWKEILPIIADCMVNASFKDDHLNSEMKAVIQELKMRKDNYVLSLAQEMMTSIFADHPYHYPIIGFKQDLWSVSSKELTEFYKKHYVPNNAVLVVVGDVKPEEVFNLAEKYFGNIKAVPDYKAPESYLNRDIISKSVTMYRDIQQPQVMLAYVVPGVESKKDYIFDVLGWLLGQGKASRLNKILVEELHLTTSVEAFTWDLFEYSLFFIAYEPKSVADIDKINEVIQSQIEDLIKNGIPATELTRAIKKAQMKFYNLLEDASNQAYEIGKYYLATRDANYIFNYLNESEKKLAKEIKHTLAQHFRPTITHKGYILPLPQSEHEEWGKVQNASDALDKEILQARIRNTSVEPSVYAKKLVAKQPGAFAFPKPQTALLPNGIKVLYHETNITPKIDLVLEFKARGYYDDEEKQGLYNFMTRMLTDGTAKYPGNKFAQELESRGMSLSAFPGGISMTMLSADFQLGLELLMQVLTQATFDKNSVEKVRAQILADINNFWDEPGYISGQLLREELYGGHPYSKNNLGKAETIKKITVDDLKGLYKKFISPDGAKFAIVGDFGTCDIKSVLDKTIGTWKGSLVEAMQFPQLRACERREVNYPINRDQVTLCFAGLSIDRKNSEYDKLLVFDQILGGGALGSMSSKLFQLREATGLFYTINGSLVSSANEQPGMVLIKTIVSLDRLAEAEKVISQTLETVTDSITPEEFEEAKNAIINANVYNFESNSSIASAFLFLDKYGFAPNYFDNRAQSLAHITINDVKQAVKKVLQPSQLLKLRVGRVEKK